jgi:hypothetical protein
MLVGCDPIAFGGLAFTPRPEVNVNDAMHDSVFAAVARVARNLELVPVDPTDLGWEGKWTQCFTGPAVVLCGKQEDNEIQFFMEQGPGVRHFTPYAKRIRQEISDTLRAVFVGSQVREWNGSYKPPAH